MPSIVHTAVSPAFIQRELISRVERGPTHTYPLSTRTNFAQRPLPVTGSADKSGIEPPTRMLPSGSDPERGPGWIQVPQVREPMEPSAPTCADFG